MIKEEKNIDNTIDIEEKIANKEEVIEDENEEKVEEKQEIKEEDKKTSTELQTKVENKINRDEEYKKIIKKRKKQLTAIIITIGIVIFLAVFSVIFAILNMNNEKIIGGITINNIQIDGLSKQDAKQTIENVINEKMEKDISLKYEDYETSINLKALEVNYNIDDVINKAYSIGRDSNIIVNNYSILKTMLFKDNIEISFTVNEEVLDTTVKEIESNLPGVVIESSYYREDKNLIVTKGTEGISINKEEFINLLNQRIEELYVNEDYLLIPVQKVQPEEISIDKIHEEIYAEAKDAYYTSNPFTLYPEVEGVDFDVDAAKQLLNEDKTEYEIPLTITKPKVTTVDIGTEAFPDLLGTFTTKYDASNTDRSTNLKLAAGKINGTVLLPGKEFSYNAVVGERTIAAGYKEAKIYSNGQVIDGLGGGICQISSTLYNAVVFANLNVTVRRNHQFVTSYVQAGRDATVVYGSQDFKFVNNRKYPIKLVTSVANGVAKISVYGIKEESEYDVSFQVNTISTIPYSVEYEETSTLAAGQESVKQKGTNGIITETYKIVKQNGVIVSKTLLSRDTYNSMKRIILKGVGGTTATTTTPETPKQETIETQTPTTEPEKPVVEDSKTNTTTATNTVQ